MNALRRLERRRAIAADAADIAADILERMRPVFHQAEETLEESLSLARKFDLSAYDASYLALALALRLPIACSDGSLRAVLPRAGVKLA